MSEAVRGYGVHLAFHLGSHLGLILGEVTQTLAVLLPPCQFQDGLRLHILVKDTHSLHTEREWILTACTQRMDTHSLHTEY